MKQTLLPLLIFLSCACTSSQDAQKTNGPVEVVSDELYNYIAADARLEVLDSGFQWTEGPTWSAALNGLLFSDIPVNRIFLWTEELGTQIYLDSAGYTGDVPRGGELGSNGLFIDSDGHLWLCQHGNRQIARMASDLHSPEAEFIGLATAWNSKKLNSPNDLCTDSLGNIYFTDPPYGLEQQMEDPTKEITFQGVYRVDALGQVVLLDSTLSRPNGIGFSPDQSELYVANSDPQDARWVAYDMRDTTFGTKRVIRDETVRVGAENPGLPDGFKVHSSGMLFATGPGGVFVMKPSGELLGLIRTGVPTANCAFDSDESYLYITADDYLMRLPLVR